MRKAFAFLLPAFLIIILVLCFMRKEKYAMVKDGLYVIMDDEMQPYVTFDSKSNTWRCGAGIAVSWSIGGIYSQKKDIITAMNDTGSDEIALFKVISENKIKALKVNKSVFPDEKSWIAEGKTYEYNTFNNAADADSLFKTICSASDALNMSKETDTVVFENLHCVSGSEIWDRFYQSVSSNSPASVLCAYYYTLDETRVSEELYEQEKDSYPVLYFYLVEYDGEKYTVKVRDSKSEEIEKHDTYKYLLHFTGEAPATALYSKYDNYVLVDDPEATWEGIFAGIISSQSGAGYRHCTVYQNNYN